MTAIPLVGELWSTTIGRLVYIVKVDSNGIRACAVSPHTQYLSDRDLLIAPDENPIGDWMMLESWHEIPVLAEDLLQAIGPVTERLQAVFFYLRVHNTVMIDWSTRIGVPYRQPELHVTQHSVVWVKDPRIDFLSMEIDIYKPLAGHAVEQIWNEQQQWREEQGLG